MNGKYFYKILLVSSIIIFSCNYTNENAEFIDKRIVINREENKGKTEQNISVNDIMYKDLSELYYKVLNEKYNNDNFWEETLFWGEEVENNICQIHNIEMYKENIRIYYGLIKPNETKMRYYELQAIYFPNNNSSINGGCVLTDKRYVEKYICDECNKKRSEYKTILGIK
jgi:hypothetical protein